MRIPKNLPVKITSGFIHSEMLGKTVTFLAILAVVAAHFCPGSSEFNQRISLKEISNQNWSIFGSLMPVQEIEDRPFQVPISKEIHVKTKLSYIRFSSNSVAEELRFEFSCKENGSRKTNFELRKVAKSFSGKVEIETFNHYCLERNSLNWPNLFIHKNENILMFYGCNNSTEFLMIFESSKVETVEVEKEVRNLLVGFHSDLFQFQNITLANPQNISNQCDGFEKTCQNKYLNEAGFHFEQNNLSFNPDEDSSNFHIFYILSGFVIVSFLLIFCAIKMKCKKKNSVGVTKQQARVVER